MARTVRKFPDGYDSRRKYDWDKFMDGRKWELTPGEDFDCTPQGFANAARDYAKRHKMTIRVTIPADHGGKVFLQNKSALGS